MIRPGTGTGGPGYRFQDEIVRVANFRGAGPAGHGQCGPRDKREPVLHHRGTPTPHLNGNHTIFGKVTEGYDVVLEISQVNTGPRDRPNDDPVVIESVEITES